MRSTRSIRGVRADSRTAFLLETDQQKDGSHFSHAAILKTQKVTRKWTRHAAMLVFRTRHFNCGPCNRLPRSSELSTVRAVLNKFSSEFFKTMHA